MNLLFSGSYGGRGGHAAGVFLSRQDSIPYGSVVEPMDFGSAGGGEFPGAGGGVIILRNATVVHVSDLTLNSQ